LSIPTLVNEFWVTAYCPFGMWYDATYSVFAVMASGLARFTCCQPDAVSLTNVTCASNVPLLFHTLATWMPVAVVRL
jgi:hypothetical protein